MPLPQSSKQKSARILWSYHKDATRLERRRRFWVILALTVTCGLVAAAWAFPSRRSGQSLLEVMASPGRLAHVHASINDNCESCHQPFASIESSRGYANGLSHWFQGKLGVSWSEGDVSNSLCQRCHSAPSHHSHMKEGVEGNCADCHQDHHGGNFSLVQLDDQACTRCHSHLHDFSKTSSLADNRKSIRDFGQPAGHPEFRSVAVEKSAERHERTLKFSHAVHMQVGLSLKSGEPVQPAFLYASIADDDYRDRLQRRHGVADSRLPVELNCADCHELDSGRTGRDGELDAFANAVTSRDGLPREAINPVRADGRYFLPIVFDTHCRSCHPLSFEQNGTDEQGRPQYDPAIQAPHRKQPSEVLAALIAHYSGASLVDDLQAANPQELIPATVERLDPPLDRAATPEERRKTLERIRNEAKWAPWDQFAALQAARPDLGQKVKTSFNLLFAGNRTCGECHIGHEDDSGANDQVVELGLASPDMIEPARIPTIWQPRANFDHVAHQAMNCKLCHPNSADTDLDRERKAAIAYAGEGHADAKHQHPPDLPSITECRKCHAPEFLKDGKVLGGVSHRCTDCHLYHNAEHGLQGRGARVIDQKSSYQSLEEFLHPTRGMDAKLRPSTAKNPDSTSANGAPDLP